MSSPPVCARLKAWFDRVASRSPWLTRLQLDCAEDNLRFEIGASAYYTKARIRSAVAARAAEERVCMLRKRLSALRNGKPVPGQCHKA